MNMRKISIFKTALCGLTIYWLVTCSFVVGIYMPSYKLLGTDHFITGGEGWNFLRDGGVHNCLNFFYLQVCAKKLFASFPERTETCPIKV